MSEELHVVLGAGQVGPMVAERLLRLGKAVRVVRRTNAAVRGGAPCVVADVRDAEQVARAAEGATVVYHCVNPRYHQWPEMLLPMTRGIVEGTARAGARLVVLDNLYVYGDTTAMSEESPVAPVSKKGALRARAAELYLEADARGRVPVAIGRAADFFGPDTPLSLFGKLFFDRVLAGRPAWFFGDLDQPHAYAYTPDVARALVALGTTAARGVYVLPTQPAEPTRQVVERFARVLGRPVATTVVREWLLRVLGLFNPEAGEMVEMTYQWKRPYRVVDARFRQAFGFTPTPWDEAVAATVAWGTQIQSATSAPEPRGASGAARRTRAEGARAW